MTVRQTFREYRPLRGLQQGDPGVRDGDARENQRLSLGVLRLSTVQSQVSEGAHVFSRKRFQFDIEIGVNRFRRESDEIPGKKKKTIYKR